MPIVTENRSHVANFEGSVLRAHIEAPRVVLDEEDVKIESFLMLANDLPKLCVVIKSIQATFPLPVRIVRYTGGDPPTFFKATGMQVSPPKKGIPTLKLRIEDQKHCQHSSQSVKTLLEPFRAVPFGMQNVKLLNIPEDSKAYAQDLKDHISPWTVWLIAVAWNYLELVRELKQQSDSLVVAGNYDRACNFYRSV